MNEVMQEFDGVAAELRSLREVIDGPLIDIAGRLSRLLSSRWPHDALVIFTRECTGRPRKVTGAPDLVEHITINELDAIKAAVEPGTIHAGPTTLASIDRWTWAVRDYTDTLLVLVPRVPGALPDSAVLATYFGIVATSIRQQVTQASPDYLAESRAASTERARTIAELTTAYEAELTAILAALRSSALDDHRARTVAAEVASTALIAVRTRQAYDRDLTDQTPVAAFERLRRDLEPLLRHQQIDAEFVAPEPGEQPIRGEVAVGARAMTQSVVLAFANHRNFDRLRIAWTCRDGALELDIRDLSEPHLDADDLSRSLAGRATPLGATLQIESVPGWGNRVTIRCPLDPPSVAYEPELARLNRREHQVLALLVAGKRNKFIAAELGVAESTIKFHMAALFRKLGVSSRGEAAAVGVRAGIGSPSAADHGSPR